jgi:hypothetical protein
MSNEWNRYLCRDDSYHVTSINLLKIYFINSLLISPLKHKQAENFCRYLEIHRHRIINDNYYQQEEICSIASGAVESTVKQIDRRLKISGVQWINEVRSQKSEVRSQKFVFVTGIYAPPQKLFAAVLT